MQIIPLSQIKPNPNNPRKINPESLHGLIESIGQIGVLEPIQVARDGGKSYRIVFGERRYHAALAAGLKEIPAIVANKELTPEEEFEMLLVENLQREDLTPIEEATAFRTALDLFGCTQAALATRLGISQPQISNTLRLLKLPEDVQQDVSDGKLSACNARALVAHDEETIRKLEPKLQGATVIAAKKIIEAAAPKPQPDNRTIDILEDLNFRWRQGDINKVITLYAQGCSIREIAKEAGRANATDGKIEVITLLLHLHRQGIVKVNFGLFSKVAR